MTYLFSKVTHLNISIWGDRKKERQRREEKEAELSKRFLVGLSFKLIHFFQKKKKGKGRRRKETRRKQDKGIKEHSIIS